MESKKFNPAEYKKYEELPKEEKENFAPVDGGFVKKEAAKELFDAEMTANIANALKNQGITSMDVLHEKAKEAERKNKEIPELEAVKLKDRALEDVKQNGRALEYASAELRADKEVVLKAVKQDGVALRYASEELQEEIEKLLK